MDLEDLEVFKLAEELVVVVYEKTNLWPKYELYGLTNQIRRASVSVALNIAEGHGRYHYKDRLKFLHQARGSLTEVWAANRIAVKLGYQNIELDNEIRNLKVKLSNFIISIQKKIQST